MPEPRDPDWNAKVRRSFAAQSFMAILGARIESLMPGICAIVLPWNSSLLQQNGFLHAGVTASIADSAAGYAAYTLMSPGTEVLTTEFKIHLLAPARGVSFRAQAAVERSGRTLTIVTCDVLAMADDGTESKIALFVGTMMAVKVPAPP